jgi:uncharacterized membrane protein
MESRYKVLGHPIHPMLIPFPLALLATAAIFDEGANPNASSSLSDEPLRAGDRAVRT